MDMDLHMDLPVGFDPGFDFGNPTLSCSSASSSFSAGSTSSSHGPYTPTSGRSTPGFQTILMEHRNSMHGGTPTGFVDLTPPASAFDGYFSPDVKVEYFASEANSYAPSTPSRKSSIQHSSMEFDYASMVPSSLPSQSTPVSSGNPRALAPYQFAGQMGSSPLTFTTPSYSLESSSCAAPSAWAPWSDDSPVSFFDKNDSPSVQFAVSDLALEADDCVSPTYVPGQSRRRVHVDGIQKRTSALHRAQQAPRDQAKRDRGFKGVVGDNTTFCAKGTNVCELDGCGRRFKRKEHLKRHVESHNPTRTKCPFYPACDRTINGNRWDNWRDHLKRHTVKGGSRTQYFPEAQAMLDAEKAKMKQRSQTKKKAGSGTKEPNL